MKIALTFAVALSIGYLSAQDLTAFKKDIYVNEQGENLPYRVLYPENYNPDSLYPLVLFLHGAGERGNDNELQLTHGATLFANSINRQNYPAIVLFPQCAKDDYWTHVERNGQNWSYPFKQKPTKSLELAIDLLEETILREAVDVDRVYVTGISMGGMGTFEVLARKPKLFAAAAPICGGSNTELVGLYAKNLPIWIFHGDADNVVPVDLSRKMYQAIRSEGGNVKYTEYPGINHNSWDKVFADSTYLKWMFAQKRTTLEKRYKEPVFQEVEKTTYVYAQKENEQLALDFYQPKADDQRQRPLLIYVHGGAFASGKRDENNIAQFAEKLAKRGYTVASITYRLTMKGKSFSCDQPTINKINTFQFAVEDIWSATNYLIQHTAELGIDTSKIVLSGSSAGAEAILHAAYWTDKDMLASSPRLPNNFRYAGLISMAGAIVDLNLITSENAIPMQFFHGTCDPLVPYNTAAHHYCNYSDVGFLMLYGSASITEHLTKLEKSYDTTTICGGGHEWAGFPMQLYVEEMVYFLSRNVVENCFYQMHKVVNQPGSDCEKGALPSICLNNE